MRFRAKPEGKLRSAFAAAPALGIAAFLSACASPSSYAGISLAPGAAEAGLQQLARRAQSGDKAAQLELGIRFEEGLGLPPDCRRALKLYRLAAASSGGTLYVYSPPVGKHGSGRVIPVNSGPRTAGLREARQRLQRLRASPCGGA